jgi:crotonobetainyl-CoA:carnitine CoA-transferase CaiB-like acyl-CoA transferase
VAIAPVYNIEDIFKEPHYWERDALTKVQDPDLGEVIVQGITPKFSRTPGAIRWLGHHIDADRQSVLHDWLHPAASGADDSDARSQTGDGR